jgi:hypothetical protein
MGTNVMQLRLTSLSGFVMVALAAIPAFAQDPLDEMYGHAVHEYYRGDVMKAEALLNDVIAAGSVDPRAYYYRGLCQAAISGVPEAGQSDFEQAAQLEIDGKRVVNIGKALERVQGSMRCHIESIRRKSRLASRTRYLEMQKLRYDESLRSGPNAVPPRRGDVPPPPVPGANDPFSDTSELNKGNPVPMPEEIKKAPPASDDPFGSDAPADATPKPDANDDPFGGNAQPPSSDDPFGN